MRESRLVREMRKFPDADGYAIRGLVMIYHETGSVLHRLQIELPHCYCKNYCMKNIKSYLFCGKVCFTTLLRDHSHTAIALQLCQYFCFHVFMLTIAKCEII